MTTTLSRLRDVRFSTAATGITMAGGLGGLKERSKGDGYARGPMNPPTIQYPYVGQLFTGSCVKAAVPPITSYYPTAEDGSIPWYGVNDGLWASLNTKLMNKAWEKFVDKVRGNSVDFGTSLAEGRETYGMIVERLVKLRRSYKELRRGNFKRFLRELSVEPRRKHRSKTRSVSHEASGLWLEYWFGWSPLLSDIFDGLDFLSGEHLFPTRRVHGSSGGNIPFSSRTTSGFSSRRVMSFQGVAFAKQGATVSYVNQNLVLLNQMGLVNPLSVVWELVPFSFVVDWFTNVGNVINGYTDLVGVSVTDPYSVKYIRGRVIGTYDRKNDVPVNTCVCKWRVGRVQRYDDLTQPVLETPILANFGDSITRAATAASLLVKMFIGR